MKKYSFVLFVLFSLSAVFSEAASPDALWQAANQAAVEYRIDLEKLADWADRQWLRAEALKTRTAVPPSESDKIFLPSYPLNVGALDLPEGLPSKLPKKYAVLLLSGGTASEQSGETSEIDSALDLTPLDIWQIQFRAIRMNYAKRLQLLAKKAVKDHRGSLAIELAVAGLHANPDHKDFRSALGFIKYKGQWRTPWEVKQLKKGFVDHERFGWIPKKVVNRYENGERYCNGEWISKADDIRKHSAIENGWEIDSEHYDLTTNHSIEEGVRLLRQNENLYRAWKLMFFRYMATDAQLASLFDSKMVPTPLERHKIVLFRDREEFLQAEKANGEKDAERFAGVYRYSGKEGAGSCIFYVDGSESVMYHESTHQLFQETKKIAGDQMLSTVSKNEESLNTWLREGVATFMDTLQVDESGYYVIGNKNGCRIQSAKQNFLDGRFFLSFSDLAEINSQEWQSPDEIDSLYDQAAAMFHFLMFYENGRLRDSLVMLLRLHYEQKDTKESIVQLTGMSYDKLDSAFKEFLRGD